MSTILVSYDLRAPGKDYSRLIEHLKSYPSWAKPLESLWLLDTSRSAVQVRDDVSGFVDSNDQLLVVDISHDSWASRNMVQRVIDWIRERL